MLNVFRVSMALPLCLAGLVLLPVPSDLSAQEPDLTVLKTFIPAANKLPETMTVVTFPAEAKEKLGFEIPGVTAKPETIAILTKEFFLEPDAANLEAMLAANYSEAQKDLGILGWQLKSAEAAKQMDAQITEKFQDFPNRVKHYQKGKYVFLIWRDEQASQEAFQALTSHVEGSLANVRAQP